MDYGKIASSIPVSKRETVSDKLTDFILTSKNDEKMPNHLADSLLYQWKNGTLASENGLAVLLEVAMLLEPEKTLGASAELGLSSLTTQNKETTVKT